MRILEQTTAPPPPPHVIQDYVGASGPPLRTAPARRSTLSASLHFTDAAAAAAVRRRTHGGDPCTTPGSSPPMTGMPFLPRTLLPKMTGAAEAYLSVYLDHLQRQTANS